MTGIMQVKLSNFALGGGNFIALLGDSVTSDLGKSISLDSSGNIYVCGQYGGAGLELAKYNSTGVIQWQVSLTANTGNGVKVDASGNVYVVGFWLDGSSNWFFIIAKYNSSGVIQWQNKYGTLTGVVNVGTSLTVDSAGNVIVCGYANSGLELVKYNSSGTEVWKQHIGAGSSQGLSVAVDSSNNIYVCGTVVITVSNTYLVKFDSSGTLQWQVMLYDFSGGQISVGNSVAVDSGNNIYVCGNNEANGAARDIQLNKFNSSGTLQWQKSLSSASSDIGNSVAVDSGNNIYVCGFTQVSGNIDVQIAKYNSSGTIQWQRKLGGTVTDLGYGITVDNANVYIGGYSNGLGTNDILVASLPSDGTKTGTYSVGGYSMTYAASSLTDLTSTLTATVGPLATVSSSLTTSSATLTAATSTLTSTVTVV